MMAKPKHNPDVHRRRSIRLPGYDYSQAAWYFVTVCTHNRESILGEIKNRKMILNQFGEAVKFTWDDLPNHNPHVELDEFTVMPNHVHGIIVITEPIGAGSEPAPTKSSRTPDETATRHGLPEIVRQFKTFSARRINQIRKTPGVPVWQRNYYEHIIRNDIDLNNIREYIINNALKWQTDKYYG